MGFLSLFSTSVRLSTKMLPVPVWLCQPVYRARVQTTGKKDIKNVSRAESLCKFCDALSGVVPYQPLTAGWAQRWNWHRMSIELAAGSWIATKCLSASAGMPHPLEFDFPVLFPTFFGCLDCPVEL